MLRFFSDSDCDVTLDICKKYGCDLISFPYEVKGELIYPYKDFAKFDDAKYYDMLRTGVLPSTSALNAVEFTAAFEPAFAAGDDIIYVHYSRAMTASFNNMDAAVKELLEKYPERKFWDVDAKGITLGALGVVMECLKLWKEGKSGDEIVEFANRLVPHQATYFFCDDLKFFRKSGRVSGLAGIMGNLIGIKPIIVMDDNGVMTNIGKVKGTKNALKTLADKFDELKSDDFENHDIYIGHGGSPDLANKLIEIIKERYGDKVHFVVSPVNPTSGAHCGPDTIGISFNAIHR